VAESEILRQQSYNRLKYQRGRLTNSGRSLHPLARGIWCCHRCSRRLVAGRCDEDEEESRLERCAAWGIRDDRGISPHGIGAVSAKHHRLQSRRNCSVVHDGPISASVLGGFCASCHAADDSSVVVEETETGHNSLSAVAGLLDESRFSESNQFTGSSSTSKSIRAPDARCSNLPLPTLSVHSRKPFAVIWTSRF